MVRLVMVRVTGVAMHFPSLSQAQESNPIVCSSVGIMLMEGLNDGSRDWVGRTVGPLYVGLDEDVGDSDGASLGSELRINGMVNSMSRV